MQFSQCADLVQQSLILSLKFNKVATKLFYHNLNTSCYIKYSIKVLTNKTKDYLLPSGILYKKYITKITETFKDRLITTTI